MIKIWTVQLCWHRYAKSQDIHVLNITAATGIQAFAPDYRALWRYKYNEINDIEYTRLYIERMQHSLKSFPEEWDKLGQYERVAVACYCTAGKFCHRHLFVPLMENKLEALGLECEYMGELAPPPKEK